MKKFKISVLIFVYMFIVAVLPVMATEPQYTTPVEYKADQSNGQWPLGLKYNVPYHITLDYLNSTAGIPGGWNALTIELCTYINGNHEDLIYNKINVQPECVSAWPGYNLNPCRYETLAINGVPWQIFESAEYPEDAKWFQSVMNDPQNKYGKIRQVLPTGNGKMVSVYDNSTIVALYTSTTVDAKHLVGRPFTQDGRMMIPVTGVVDYLGADVSWDKETNSTVVKQSDKEIRLQNNSTTAYINGNAVVMDVAPVIKDGRTFVPLRFVSDTLGFKVKWIGDIDSTVRRADIYN